MEENAMYVCIDGELFMIDDARSNEHVLSCTSLEDFQKRIFYRAELNSRKVQYNESNLFNLDI